MTGSFTYIDRHRSRLFLIARRALGPFSLRRMRHYIIIAVQNFPWNLESWQDMGDWGRVLREQQTVRRSLCWVDLQGFEQSEQGSKIAEGQKEGLSILRGPPVFVF